MDNHKIISEIIGQLEETLREREKSVEYTRVLSQEAPTRMEARYDSSREDFARLAGAIDDSATELDQLIRELRKTKGTLIAHKGGYYLLVSKYGGKSFATSAGKITLVSKESPLGQKLAGQDEGQLGITPRIKALAQSAEGEGIALLKNLKIVLVRKLTLLPYNDQTAEAERKIRHRRTADEVIRDGFVYSTKSCTDIVVAYMALAKARGLKTTFVKLIDREKQRLHSVAEVEMGGKTYLYDVSMKDGELREGGITPQENWHGYRLWKKGRDSWDIGQRCADDAGKIK